MKKGRAIRSPCFIINFTSLRTRVHMNDDRDDVKEMKILQKEFNDAIKKKRYLSVSDRIKNAINSLIEKVKI